MGRAWVYAWWCAEMYVEDASEYIWLRLEARSVFIGKSQSVKFNCGPREVWFFSEMSVI